MTTTTHSVIILNNTATIPIFFSLSSFTHPIYFFKL